MFFFYQLPNPNPHPQIKFLELALYNKLLQVQTFGDVLTPESLLEWIRVPKSTASKSLDILTQLGLLVNKKVPPPTAQFFLHSGRGNPLYLVGTPDKEVGWGCPEEVIYWKCWNDCKRKARHIFTKGYAVNLGLDQSTVSKALQRLVDKEFISVDRKFKGLWLSHVKPMKQKQIDKNARIVYNPTNLINTSEIKQ